MGNRLYVGNLPYSVRDERLAEVFRPFGNVASARVMMERDSGRSKGFGFVEMADEAQAQAAIAGLHGQPLDGRDLVVNEARPMTPRPPRTEGYGGGYNSGGYGGGARRESSAGGGWGRGNAELDGTFRSPYGPGPRTRRSSNNNG
ncbi:MAG: RNA-binding protein, partial [Ottowia sp.]|nr:RNA-binding protein [Ottowia sp.]